MPEGGTPDRGDAILEVIGHLRSGLRIQAERAYPLGVIAQRRGSDDGRKNRSGGKMRGSAADPAS
jgi:hypothetical protein